MSSDSDLGCFTHVFSFPANEHSVPCCPDVLRTQLLRFNLRVGALGAWELMVMALTLITGEVASSHPQ